MITREYLEECKRVSEMYKKKHPDRDVSRCEGCMYQKYLLCPYVKVDGICTITGRLVRE
jgi:hypothetical protein